MEKLTIGRLASKAGVHVETVRYYERRGLIVRPSGSDVGYRLYSDDIVARIRFIKRAQDLGFTLKEVSELLALQAEPEATCGDVQRRAEAKIAQIDEKIRALQRIRRGLEEVVPACRRKSPASECPILMKLDSKDLRERPEGRPK